MISVGPLVRLRRLSREQKRLLVRASTLLAAASGAVALLPFRHAIRFGCAPLGKKKPSSVEDIVWAVEAASRRVPWRTMCIEKGLAVQRMLRSSGMDAILHYGARHHADNGRLEAHVWITAGAETITGGEHAADFAELATFP